MCSPTKLLFVVLALVVPLALGGCTTRSKARADTRIAYLEGQRQMQAQMIEARRTSIRVLGNVQNREIAWADGLTLAQTLATAQYLDRNAPREIIIVRQSGRFPVDVDALLRGEDLPLQPGDTVELHP